MRTNLIYPMRKVVWVCIERFLGKMKFTNGLADPSMLADPRVLSSSENSTVRGEFNLPGST